MYESAVSVFKPDGAAYLQSLHKLIFLELFLRDEQWRTDGWPTEQERSLFSSACTQVGHENLLLFIFKFCSRFTRLVLAWTIEVFF